MRRPQEIAHEVETMGTIVNLTSVFENLASMQIARVKNQVLQSQAFFGELWHIYNQLRVDSLFRFGRQENDQVIDKELFIAITAEGGFSGDIDQKLISWMLGKYDPSKHDIIIIGHHGAVQLAQNDVQFKKYYPLPSKDQNINVTPLIKHIREYRSTTVFYQTYVSLMVQDIKSIELRKAVQEAGSKVEKNTDVIDEKTYIFEPSSYAVVAHLERIMLEITLSQAILDSKLAQYASRFRSMSAANDRAEDSHSSARLQYLRAKRAIGDERLKETVNAMKKVQIL